MRARVNLRLKNRSRFIHFGIDAADSFRQEGASKRETDMTKRERKINRLHRIRLELSEVCQSAREDGLLSSGERMALARATDALREALESFAA